MGAGLRRRTSREEWMSMAGKRLGTLLVIVTLFAAMMPDEVWARAGGGMSSGSRGSRSYSSPSRSYSAPSQPTSPTPQPFTQPQPMQQTAPAGGFWQSMAGGFLGGMLFRSLGFGGGYGGGFGGGFGMFDLL